MEQFQDMTLRCAECGEAFNFSARDQKFRRPGMDGRKDGLMQTPPIIIFSANSPDTRFTCVG